MFRIERLKWLWVVLTLAVVAASPAAAESIYWVDTSFPAPMLGKADADGMNPVTIPLPPGSLPEGLALDEFQGNLYWAEAAWTGAAIGRAAVSLTGLSDLITGGSVLRDVDIDETNGKLYWTSSNLVTGSQLHRADLDGTNAAVLANLGSAVNLRGVAVDPATDRVYLADYDGGVILVHDLAGAVAGASLPAPGVWGLSWDILGGMLYWTDYAAGRLMRANTGTGTSTQILGGLGNPTYLDVDPVAGRVYWVEAVAGGQRIQRANFDGTLLQDLGLPIAAYGGIQVGPDAPTPTLLLMLQADAVEDGIELRWQFASPGQFQRTDLERADAWDGPWTRVAAEMTEELGRMVAIDRTVESGRTYHYRLAVLDEEGSTAHFGPISATAGQGVVEFALSSISPNPTRGTARIDYALPRTSPVRLTVIDVQGREVAKLFEGTREPGRYQAIWSGEGDRGRVPAGLYFVLYRTPDRDFVRRVVMQN